MSSGTSTMGHGRRSRGDREPQEKGQRRKWVGGYWELGKRVSKEFWSTGSKVAADPPEVPFVFRTVWWLGPWKEPSVENMGPA